jgi:hypothetical protein
MKTRGTVALTIIQFSPGLVPLRADLVAQFSVTKLAQIRKTQIQNKVMGKRTAAATTTTTTTIIVIIIIQIQIHAIAA